LIDFIRVVATALLFVELLPQQLVSLGYSWPVIISTSLVIYLIRLLLEVIIVRLGIDLIGFILKPIKKITKWLLIKLGYKKISNKTNQPKQNRKNSKLVKYFFALGPISGIFLAAAIPLVPPSAAVVIYNLRQAKHKKYSFKVLCFNWHFLALMLGGCVRILLAVAGAYSISIL